MDEHYIEFTAIIGPIDEPHLDAQAITELRARAETAEAERDRLRAVAEAARRLLRTNTTTDAETSLVAEIDHWALVALDDALHGLDGSADMGGAE